MANRRFWKMPFNIHFVKEIMIKIRLKLRVEYKCSCFGCFIPTGQTDPLTDRLIVCLSVGRSN